MAEHLYGEEWDSDEFQTALKVVLKCEIQSLLERLSETGEETVLLTASAADLCVGHLASANALRFVNTTDVGLVKNKFLNFLTGTKPQPQAPRPVTTGPGTSAVTGKVAQVSPVINNLTSKGPAQTPVPDSAAKKPNVKAITPSQTKAAEKRPLEAVVASPDFSSQSLDAKRRKTESQTPSTKGNINTSLQSPSNPSVTQASAPNVGKGPAPKLKTTKVVSKSGGFTEERISDAEFQKFLAQYKPNIPEGEEVEGSDHAATVAMLRTGSMPQITPQKQFQSSPVTSVQNTQNKGTSQVNSLTDKSIKTGNQPGKNQSTQQTELKKDNSSAKHENKSVNKENRECVNTSNVEMLTEIKEELDPDDSEYAEAQASAKKQDNEQNVSKEKDKNVAVSGNVQKKDTGSQQDRAGLSSQNRNRLESIDNLDTETLIQMTKAKHQENMSEADREIQAKLGQLSSKLSWVVEFPKEMGQSGPSGQATSIQRPQGIENPGMAAARQMHHGPYRDNQGYEMEEMEDEDFEDDEEFDEDDLDEEDKAALKAMREAHMRKLGNPGMVGFGEEGEMYDEGFGVSQNFHPAMGQEFPEDYDEEEDYEGFEDYNSEEEMGVNMAHLGDNRVHGTLQNLSGRQGQGERLSVSGHQPYQRTSSPTSENFLMIGPIMAKCLICNKIVRKTEMKAHHETHLKEEDQYDEEEEGEEDIEEMEENIGDEDGGSYQEEQKTLQGEYEPEEGEYSHEAGEYGEDEGEYPQEEGEYSEDYEFQADETEDGMAFTAEKFVAEKLVAEKLGEVSETSKDSKDNVCDICNKSFKTPGNMLRHRKNIHNLKEDKDSKDVNLACTCPVCGKSFRYLQKHIKKKHPDFGDTQSGDVSENSVDSKLNCNICGELFTEEDKLKEHFKCHA